MVSSLPDVQANKPSIGINLTRVGVENVKKLVEVARAGNKRPIILVSDFHVFVDLPSDIKGANLSRNFEAIYEVLEEATSSPTYEVEELCSEVAKRLLLRHGYASVAEVGMKAEYIIKRKTPVTKKVCQEVATIYAEAKAFRDNGVTRIRKKIGAEVVGMTTCPCAQEIMKEKVREELMNAGVDKEKIEQLLENIPMATHNQRGRGRICIEVEDHIKVSLQDIIKIIEDSMSSKTYELLKRPDEAYLVEMAHRRSMFAEDCVREMAKGVVETFKELPDDSIISIRQVNEESIHQHNAIAERVAYLRELRKEIEECRRKDAGVA
ncbi:MAG: GTP cyclohydrolase MptA [Candidatus Methanospirareceae archaeon]